MTCYVYMNIYVHAELRTHDKNVFIKYRTNQKTAIDLFHKFPIGFHIKPPQREDDIKAEKTEKTDRQLEEGIGRNSFLINRRLTSRKGFLFI